MNSSLSAYFLSLGIEIHSRNSYKSYNIDLLELNIMM